MKSLYSRGFQSLSVGAESEMTFSQYRTIADTIAKTSATPYGVVGLKKNNITPTVFTYGEAEGANEKYNALADDPGDFVYIYLFRDRLPVDEGYFTAAPTRYESHTETRKERAGLWWILGGTAVALGGAVIAISNRRKGG